MKNKITLLAFLALGGIMTLQSAPQNIKIEKAIFAGGCFWCMEAAFEKLDGVLDVISGYIGGVGTWPNYTTYAKQKYIEAIEITYDPQIISYEQLLDAYWRNIDPTDAKGQFVDRGPQYRAVIYYLNKDQKKKAEISKRELDKSGRFAEPIVTEIVEAPTFYKAEDYHQNFSKKHSWRYKIYRYNSGRDQFLTEAWGRAVDGNYIKPPNNVLHRKLTDAQYKVTQQNATERPFANKYWDHYEPGIYVDIVSGEPLFSSADKYNSKTGWPSFTQPLERKNIVEKKQKGWFTQGKEVRSKKADSHLGHVFKDGPPPKKLRYCINSASLRFVPADKLKEEGYGQYQKLFK